MLTILFLDNEPMLICTRRGKGEEEREERRGGNKYLKGRREGEKRERRQKGNGF